MRTSLSGDCDLSPLASGNKEAWLGMIDCLMMHPGAETKRLVLTGSIATDGTDRNRLEGDSDRESIVEETGTTAEPINNLASELLMAIFLGRLDETDPAKDGNDAAGLANDVCDRIFAEPPETKVLLAAIDRNGKRVCKIFGSVPIS